MVAGTWDRFMTSASRLRWACIVVASVALLLGYALGGLGLWAAAALLVGGFWLLGVHRSWRWSASVNLALLVAMAAAGVALGSAPGWMLVGLVAALMAWDLCHFLSLLHSAQQVVAIERLEQDHLRRLAIAAGLGLVLAALALLVRNRLGFWAVVLLGLVGLWSLSRVVAYFRTESE
jgi:hypothetical protein